MPLSNRNCVILDTELLPGIYRLLPKVLLLISRLHPRTPRVDLAAI